MNRSDFCDKSECKNAVAELVKQARDGSQNAFLKLKSQYTPLLESQVLKHKFHDMTEQDEADLREEALVIFCNAVCNYDYSEDGVEFGLYAKICIENGLVSFIRSYYRRKKKAVLPLEYAERAADGAVYDPLQALVDKENTSELVRVIRKNLSDYENRVWWLYVSGMSASEISRELKVNDSKSVSNAIYRIRRKLRGFVSDR